MRADSCVRTRCTIRERSNHLRRGVPSRAFGWWSLAKGLEGARRRMYSTGSCTVNPCMSFDACVMLMSSIVSAMWSAQSSMLDCSC